MPTLDRSHRIHFQAPVRLTLIQRTLMPHLIRAIREAPDGLTAEILANRARLPIAQVHHALTDLPQKLTAARYPFPLTKSPRQKNQGAPRYRLNNHQAA